MMTTRGQHWRNELPFSPLTTETLASMTATHLGTEDGWLTQHDIADALVQRITGRRYASADAAHVDVGNR